MNSKPHATLAPPDRLRQVLRRCRDWVLAGGLALALGAAGTVHAQSGLRLPDMGEPADQTLSPREEAQVGAEFMRMVRSRHTVIDDPLLQTYITGLGERLARSSTGNETGFTFFIVDDPAINAFAAPGGYVGINTGLILSVETEAQLAAVVAHEIAHVTQRHLARAFSSAERSALPTAAGIIAAILLGGVSPQASQAALATTIAANAQQQINYTRTNEQEADRVGIGFLAGAGYDPSGMSEVFDLLRQASSLGSRPPAYLSTHPLSEARIAEAHDRALSLRQPDQLRDDPVFQIIKARTRVLTDPNPGRLVDELLARAAHQTGSELELTRYAAAVAALRTRDPVAAAEPLAALLRTDPGNFHYRLEQASYQMRAGDAAAGRSTFESLLELYPLHFPIVARYAGLLTEAGAARQAIDLLNAYTRGTSRPAAQAYRLMAEAYDRAGQRVLGMEALAEYHYLLGEIGTAIQNLRIAANQSSTGSEDRIRIEARLDTLSRKASNALQQK